MQTTKIENLCRIISVFTLISVFIFLPFDAQAGLVPCGLGQDDPNQPGDQTQPCGFCDFFVLFNNIINFLFKLVPVVAAFMLFFAGIKFFMAIENPGEVENAKNVIKSVIIGLIIIYAAWALVGAFLATIGLATWTENMFRNWWTNGLFQINC